MTVQDAPRLTRFKDGPGRDPRDIVFEASLDGAAVACSLSRSQMDVDVVLRVAVSAGPSVGTGVSRVPYFVRVLNSSGVVVQGQEFRRRLQAVAVQSARPVAGGADAPAAVTAECPTVQGYRIAVGLKPTQRNSSTTADRRHGHERLCRTAGSSCRRSGRSLHRLRQVLRGLPDRARDRPRCRRGEASRRRAVGADARRRRGRRPAEVAQRLRRQRALQRRLPRRASTSASG